MNRTTTVELLDETKGAEAEPHAIVVYHDRGEHRHHWQPRCESKHEGKPCEWRGEFTMKLGEAAEEAFNHGLFACHHEPGVVGRKTCPNCDLGG